MRERTVTHRLDSVDVKPFVGFADVRLGAMRETVATQLGAPDSVRTEEEGGRIADEYWDYERDGVTLCFSADDEFRLGTATFRRVGQTLSGVAVIGLSVSEIFALFSAGLLPEISLEQDFPELGAANYECPGYGVSFWVSESVVDNFTMYPKYDDTGNTVLWPTP